MVTHLEKLEEIGNKNTINEEEEKIVWYWVLQLGFKDSIVTCGIIYPFGRGQTVSCNQFAKMLVDTVKEKLK